MVHDTTKNKSERADLAESTSGSRPMCTRERCKTWRRKSGDDTSALRQSRYGWRGREEAIGFTRAERLDKGSGRCGVRYCIAMYLLQHALESSEAQNM